MLSLGIHSGHRARSVTIVGEVDTIITLGACTRVLQLVYSLCVTMQSAFSMAIGFSLGLSDFQLTDLSKMPSFLRKSASHGYFVLAIPCIIQV